MSGEAGGALEHGAESQGSQGLPLPILNAGPGQRRDPFQGLTRSEDGQGVYASDLAQDNQAGFAASFPYVAMTSTAVCSDMRITNTPSLGFGALVSGAPKVPTPLPQVKRRPTRCSSCGAYANLYCCVVPHTGEWHCPFCSTANARGSEFAVTDAEDFSTFPELSQRGIEYVEAHLGRTPASGARPEAAGAEVVPPAPVLLVLDECLDEHDACQLRLSLLDFLSKLAPETRIGILSCGTSVSVYDLSQPALARADVFPGDASPSEASLRSLFAVRGAYLAPIHACLPAAQAVVSSLRPYRGPSPHAPPEARPRCLGAAVEFALALIRGRTRGWPTRTNGVGRVLVATAGPITHGPGTVGTPLAKHRSEHAAVIKYLEGVGRTARYLNTGVDVLYDAARGVPETAGVMLQLTANCGGVLMLLDSFCASSFAANALRAVGRVTGSDAFVEFRSSKSVAVSRFVGPVEEISRRDAGAAVAEFLGRQEEYFPRDTSTVLEFAGAMEEGQGVTFCFEMTSDEPRDFVYFQFAFRFVDVNQYVMLRVITLRLPTTSDPYQYLESVCQDESAVVIAKKTVLAAGTAEEAAEQRTWVEARAKDLAIKLGKGVPRSKMLHFPNQLPRVLESLYFLRRGPLLSTASEANTLRTVLRQIFLRSSLDSALRMLLPRLVMLPPGRPPLDVPPADLALWSDVALVLDVGTDILIWLGAEVARGERRKAAEAECRRICEHMSSSRFPVPCIHLFEEGSEEAEVVLLPLLTPAHKDPPTQQELRFPPLREMLPDEKGRLKAKLQATADESYCEWLRRLSLVAPDPGA